MVFAEMGERTHLRLSYEALSYAFILLLSCLSSLSLAAFCCIDPYSNEEKCWNYGTCCDNEWYEGCVDDSTFYCPNVHHDCAICVCYDHEPCEWEPQYGCDCKNSEECIPENCACDYDANNGCWCAPITNGYRNCAHSTNETCDESCYSYVHGDFAPDCKSTREAWRCDNGTWVAHPCDSGEICSDGICTTCITFIDVNFSDPHPNYGDIIYAYINASYVASGTGEQANCTPENCEIVKLMLNQTEVTGSETWNEEEKRWELEINTSLYSPPLYVEIYFKDCDFTDSQTAWFIINHAPNISEVNDYPDPVDSEGEITISAIVSELDENDSVSSVVACESVAKSGEEYVCINKYCDLIEVETNNYTCSFEVAWLGTGTKSYVILASDSYGFQSVSDEQNFTVRNITIMNFEVTGNTSELFINASWVVYENYDFVNGSAICWLNELANNCTTSVLNGAFNCSLQDLHLVVGENELHCRVNDSYGIDGEVKRELYLAGEIQNFTLTSNSVVGIGGSVAFNATIRNIGTLNWSGSNVKALLLYYPKFSPQNLRLACEAPLNLESGNEINWNCAYDLQEDPGRYEFFLSIRYYYSGGFVEIERSDEIEVEVIKMETEVKIVGLDYGAVLPCEQGLCDANYTRGDLAEFRITTRIWTTPFTYKYCDGSPLASESDRCDCYYSLDGGELKSASWTAENNWRVLINTSQLTCGFHDVVFRVYHRGIESSASIRFYLSCVPRVLAVPNIARVALNQNATIVFHVHLKNPTDEEKRFDLRMKAEQPIINWLCFVVNGQNVEDKNLSDLSVNPISQLIIPVNLTQASRAGAYEIEFEMEDSQTGDIYKTKATLIIFAEAMPDFNLASFFILSFLAAWVMRKRIRL